MAFRRYPLLMILPFLFLLPQTGWGAESKPRKEEPPLPELGGKATLWGIGWKGTPKSVRKTVRSEISSQFKAADWKLKRVPKKKKKAVNKIKKKCESKPKECAIEVGTELGVAHILVAQLAKKKKKKKKRFELTLIMVDVKNEKMLGIASGEFTKRTVTKNATGIVTRVLEEVKKRQEAVRAEAIRERERAKTKQMPSMDRKKPPPKRVTKKESEKKALKVKKRVKPKGSLLGLGLHFDLLVPAAKTGDVTYGQTLEPEGNRKLSFGGLADVRYNLPPPVDGLALGVQVGWYRLSSSASRQSPNDPDFGDFSYEWQIDAVPILIGPYYTFPLPIPLRLTLGVGLTIDLIWAQTSFTANGSTQKNESLSDTIVGYYGSAEAGLELGPGILALGVRYTDVRTDFGLEEAYGGAYNSEAGALGGTSITLGYRFQISL